MQKTRQIFELLHLSEKLKTQTRFTKLSDNGCESVGDHSWHCAFMALIIHPYIDEEIDLLKVLKMIIVHDLVEARIGDVPYSEVHNNPQRQKEKIEQEESEMEYIKSIAPNEVAQDLHDLWEEYEERKSKEAIFAKAIDSLEADLQATMLNDASYWDDIFYEIFFDKSKKLASSHNVLEELHSLISDKSKSLIKKIKN